MKKLLSLLMAYVFLQAQTWALSGGPVYGNASNGGSPIGTFSGVLKPTGGVTNAFGVFGIVVPAVNLATGAFVYFASGETFIGAIEGSGDPSNLVISGLLSAQANVTSLVPSTANVGGVITAGSSQLQTVPVGFANGFLNAVVVPPQLLAAGGVVRLNGKATLDVQGASAAGVPAGAITVLIMKVDGFEQTTATTTTFDLSNFTTAVSGAAGTSSTATNGG
jgi:hypothetical protein